MQITTTPIPYASSSSSILQPDTLMTGYSNIPHSTSDNNKVVRALKRKHDSSQNIDQFDNLKNPMCRHQSDEFFNHNRIADVQSFWTGQSINLNMAKNIPNSELQHQGQKISVIHETAYNRLNEEKFSGQPQTVGFASSDFYSGYSQADPRLV